MAPAGTRRRHPRGARRGGGDSGAKLVERPFGLVLVPRAWQMSCNVDLSPEEELEMLSM